MNYTCEEHPGHFECPDQVVGYEPMFDEYMLLLRDGGGLVIRFCPWCGFLLPESKRDLWFERLETMGFTQPLFREDIPDEYKSDAWYRGSTGPTVPVRTTGRVNICWDCTDCAASNRTSLDPWDDEGEINWAEDAVIEAICKGCGLKHSVCLNVTATATARPESE